jgi:hypothetical protein
VQAGVSKQCSTNQIATFVQLGYASLSAPNTWVATQTFPANSLTLSELPQIAAQSVLGNATAVTANVTAPWTVSNSIDTVIPLTHGAITAAGDVACYNDTAGTIKDCEGTSYLVATSSAGVSIPASGTKINLTSVSLTTGTWFCSGQALVQNSGSVSSMLVGLSTTSASFPAVPFYGTTQGVGTGNNTQIAPTQILAGPATAYLVVTSNFSTGTATAYGNIVCTLVR